MQHRTVIVIAVGFVLVAGVVIALFGRGDEGDSAPTTAPHPASPGGRPGTAAATPEPVGQSDDREAARAAAIDAVAMTGEIVAAGAFTRRDLITAISSRRFGPTLANVTSQAIESMLLELGEQNLDFSRLQVVERPVSSHIEQVTDGSVRVSVWSVMVIALPGAGPGRSTWRTVTLDMVNEDGRWVINDWSTVPGPSPMPPAEGVFEDAGLVATRLRWEPVVGPAELAGV